MDEVAAAISGKWPGLFLTAAVLVSNQRAAHSFQVGQKLEAVDRRNPMLIRVATVTETEDYRLQVEPAHWLCGQP